MIEVHRQCGGHRQDIVAMHGNEIDCGNAVWEYRPTRHNTEHHNDVNDLDRIVYFGPKAQANLRPLLAIGPNEYLFAPGRAELSPQCKAAQCAQMSDAPEPGTTPSEKPQPFAVTCRLRGREYRRAVRLACQAAAIPIRRPNQRRHSRLTEIRKEFGLEASRVVSGIAKAESQRTTRKWIGNLPVASWLTLPNVPRLQMGQGTPLKRESGRAFLRWVVRV